MPEFALTKLEKTMPADQAAALADLARQISEGGRDRYESLRSIFGLRGDKWSILILLVLATGEMRHAALRRAVDSVLGFETISQRILTLKLRAFEQHGLIVRLASDDVPPKVGYRLTEKGKVLSQHVWRTIEAFRQS